MKLTTSFLIVVLAPSALLADVIHLKDGRKLEGEVEHEGGDTIELAISLGGGTARMTVKKSDIKHIERKKSSRKEYRERLAQAEKANSAEAWGALADWCKENRFLSQGREARDEEYKGRLAEAKKANTIEGWSGLVKWCEDVGRSSEAQEAKNIAQDMRLQELGVSVVSGISRRIDRIVNVKVVPPKGVFKETRSIWEWSLDLDLKEPIYLFTYTTGIPEQICRSSTWSKLPDDAFGCVSGAGKLSYRLHEIDKEGEQKVKESFRSLQSIQYSADEKFMVKHGFLENGSLTRPISVRPLTAVELEEIRNAKALHLATEKVWADREQPVRVASALMDAILEGKGTDEYVKPGSKGEFVVGLRAVGKAYGSIVSQQGGWATVVFPVRLVTRAGLLKETFVLVHLRLDLHEARWYVEESKEFEANLAATYRGRSEFRKGLLKVPKQKVNSR